MFAICDVNTRKLLQRYVYKMASARIEVYDATKITFRTFHWYSYCYTDVPRPSRFSCKGLACETSFMQCTCTISLPVLVTPFRVIHIIIPGAYWAAHMFLIIPKKLVSLAIDQSNWSHLLVYIYIYIYIYTGI